MVSVSRRHAFPPSRVPHGKMGDDSAAGFGAMRGEAHAGTGAPWMTSYDVSREGILPAGWLEKHARALPSAIVVVASLPSLRGDGDEAAAATRAGIRNAARAVADLRLTLAPKRSVPVHLVCLLAPREGETDGGPSAPRDAAPEEATKEKVCQECHLPQSQVFLLRCPADLAPDDFGSKILRSPYLAGNAAGGPGTPNSAAAAPDHHGTGGAALLNPLLRRLDRALRDASALYYSRQAEAQERKLALWRSRYHGANASFEVNTLMAAMRCARYATKVATLREFQMRTGVGGGAVVMGGGSGAGGGAPLGGSGGGGARWTDRGSSAMRHYDEAYRWVAELHRRAVAWRAAAAVAAGASSASLPPGRAPVTPRATPGGVGGLYGGTTPGGTALGSPQVSESPGGGIGVELSLPGLTADAAAAAPPPPPLMRRDSPALTSAKGYDADENVAFFAALWEQCRAVASLLNAKLLRCTSPDALDDGRRASPGGVEAQEQWNRHRLLFLATPPDVPHFVPTENDDVSLLRPNASPWDFGRSFQLTPCAASFHFSSLAPRGTGMRTFLRNFGRSRASPRDGGGAPWPRRPGTGTATGRPPRRAPPERRWRPRTTRSPRRGRRTRNSARRCWACTGWCGDRWRTAICPANGRGRPMRRRGLLRRYAGTSWGRSSLELGSGRCVGDSRTRGGGITEVRQTTLWKFWRRCLLSTSFGVAGRRAHDT